MRVIVVGGGPAGLAAAHVLSKMGASPLVLEAQDRIGGRAYSRRVNGYVVDLGTQFLSAGYRSTLQLCDELMLTDQVCRFKLNVGILRDGGIRTGLRSVPWLNRLGFIRLLAWVFLHRNRLTAGSRPGCQLDDISIASFVLEHYDRALLENWFQPFVSGATSAMPEDVSASCALGYMAYNLRPCLALRGGTGVIMERLAEILPEVRLNARVTRVIFEDKRVRGVEVTRRDAKERVDADGVIVTVPAPAAADTLPDLPSSLLDFLRNVPYTCSIHLALGLRRKALKSLYGVAIPRKSGFRVALLTEDANKCDGYTPEGAGVLHAVTYDDRSQDLWNEPDSVVSDLLSREVRQILPEFTDAPLFSIVHRWSRNMCVIRPGHFRQVAAFQRELESIEGLAFAGDYLTLPCLEGAIVSGQNAAKDLVGVKGGRTSGV